MRDAIAAGLIAGGALLLVTTLVWPVGLAEWVGLAEYWREKRAADIAVSMSAVATFTGAVLLLFGGAWPWALLGAALPLAFYYSVLVLQTRQHWKELLTQIVHERTKGDGRVTSGTAIKIGLSSDRGQWDPVTARHLVNDESFGAYGQRLAERNSSWSWALRHPRGGGPGRLEL
jgi:hypothetical protein